MDRTRRKTAPEQLRVRLEGLGWSQTDLANALGVSDGVVSRWLSGERTPSLEMAFRIQRSKVGLSAEVWIEVVPTRRAG